ncbi:MAG: hypothetical protein H5T75_08400 [Coriobacteriia bacterium]|nr:hypothetical protein [Coriobacteriia bacterium]
MSAELIAAVAIVILSSAAFVVAGTITRWDLTSRTNAYAMRAIGAVTLVALATVAAWSRRSDPAVAVAIVLCSFAAAFGYVRMHVALTRQLTEGAPEGSEQPK